MVSEAVPTSSGRLMEAAGPTRVPVRSLEASPAGPLSEVHDVAMGFQAEATARRRAAAGTPGKVLDEIGTILHEHPETAGSATVGISYRVDAMYAERFS
jgi:hypothetical protein